MQSLVMSVTTDITFQISTPYSLFKKCHGFLKIVYVHTLHSVFCLTQENHNRHEMTIANTRTQLIHTL